MYAPRGRRAAAPHIAASLPASSIPASARPGLLVPRFLGPALLGGLLATTAVLFPCPTLADQDSRRWSSEQMDQSTFDVRPGGMLQVDVPDADIELRTGGADRVEIEIELRARDLEWAREVYKDMDFRIDGSSDKVSIRARSVNHGWRDWDRYGGYAVTLRIVAPETFDVDLETGDGDVRVERLKGSAVIETSDGDIHIDRIEGPRVYVTTSDGHVELGDVTSPDIRIESSDGRITADALDGDEIDVHTSDGDIDVDQVSGALNASTHDGDIRVGIARFAATSLKSGDGDIHILAPADMQAELDLRGERLSLRNANIRFEGQMSKTSARGALNGGGPRLRAVTSDGTIVLSSR